MHRPVHAIADLTQNLQLRPRQAPCLKTRENPVRRLSALRLILLDPVLEKGLQLGLLGVIQRFQALKILGDKEAPRKPAIPDRTITAQDAQEFQVVLLNAMVNRILPKDVFPAVALLDRLILVGHGPFVPAQKISHASWIRRVLRSIMQCGLSHLVRSQWRDLVHVVQPGHDVNEVALGGEKEERWALAQCGRRGDRRFKQWPRDATAHHPNRVLESDHAVCILRDRVGHVALVEDAQVRHH
mmetsp:Transcript_19486/g.56842  ORF Transcript_19486/g.56842 Transcript_19486/m.56842 type:complete len:242 (-) Transcript_19486:189-914(-)